MILNFTQHKATADQVAAGVIDVPTLWHPLLVALLTFDTLPSTATLLARASEAVQLISDIEMEVGGATFTIMLGGAPFFMSYLEQALKDAGMQYVYAFSQRVSEDQIQADGNVRKVAVFKHLGFVQ